MEGITRVICLLLLLGIAAAHKLSSDELALDQILQHMEDSASPCDDYHTFSSGKFHDLHKENGINNLCGLAKQKFNERMQIIFERLKYRVLNDPTSVEEKVWLLYNTCITAPRFTHSWKHYIGLVSPGSGLTWPHLTPRDSQWPEENFKWLETLGRLRHFGLDKLLIEMKVQPGRDKFKVIIGKQKINAIEEEVETKDLLTSIGVSQRKAGILARDIEALEREIRELGELIGYRKKELSLAEFENRTKLALGKYLDTVFGSSFDPSFVVETSELPYLEGLQALLDKFESETVASYLMIGFVRYLRDLDGSGAEGDPAKCAATVALHMDTASELLYKDFYFRLGKFQRYNDEVKRLFDLISKPFLARVESKRLNLTDEEVQFLKQKINSMTVTLGKLPQVENQRSFVNDFYWNLNLASSELDFAVMHLKVLEHRNRKVLEQLDGPMAKGTEFYLLSNDDYASAEPQFVEFKNTVVLPLVILQEPFFTPELHDVFKVSLLGFLLTRQTLRNEGVKGSLINPDGEENEGFDDASICLNGTRLELIQDHLLDVIALKTVYSMYFGDNTQFSQEQPSFTKLPLRQLFLLNFAQVFAGNGGTMKLRLSEAVRNLQPFGQVFNCPAKEGGMCY